MFSHLDANNPDLKKVQDEMVKCLYDGGYDRMGKQIWN
jgi:hypothetical protein